MNADHSCFSVFKMASFRCFSTNYPIQFSQVTHRGLWQLAGKCDDVYGYNFQATCSFIVLRMSLGLRFNPKQQWQELSRKLVIDLFHLCFCEILIIPNNNKRCTRCLSCGWEIPSAGVLYFELFGLFLVPAYVPLNSLGIFRLFSVIKIQVSMICPIKINPFSGTLLRKIS